MDVVNFPGIIAQHGLLEANEIDIANDLLLIGKKVNGYRNGTQYEELAISIQEFASLVAGGAETLAQTLAAGNTTGGNDIIISNGDSIVFNSGAFSGTIVPSVLAGNVTWSLPTSSGTIALTSDILNIYNSDGIVGSGRIATITDTLTFAGGKIAIQDGTEGTAGYLWTSIDGSGTGSWIPSPVASVNIYNSDGTITDPIRNVVIDQQLVFFGGDIGIGTSTIASAKLTVQAFGSQTEGTVITTSNITPTDRIFQVRDAGGINALTVLINRTSLIDSRLIVGTTLGSVSSTATFVTKSADSLFANKNTELTDGSNTRLWEIRNNGNVGHNANATAGDRYFMVAGAGNDGGLNISAFNLANNGYGILVQGGSGGANYSGILCDANGGSTGINRAGFFGAGVSGPQENYGIYSGSRNGSVYSVALYGVAQGGDAINPSEFAAAVWAQVMTQQADDRRAINATIAQAGNVNNSDSYGMKFEVGYVSVVVNEEVWGLHLDCSATGAGVINTAGHFTAAGAGGATNYALVTNGGNLGFGTITPNAQSMTHIVPGARAHLLLDPITAAVASAITPVNGMQVHVSTTNGTFTSVGLWSYEGGAWVKM